MARVRVSPSIPPPSHSPSFQHTLSTCHVRPRRLVDLEMCSVSGVCGCAPTTNDLPILPTHALQAKKQNEEHTQILAELMTHPGNRICADCHEKGETALSIVVALRRCGHATRRLAHLWTGHAYAACHMCGRDAGTYVSIAIILSCSEHFFHHRRDMKTTAKRNPMNDDVSAHTVCHALRTCARRRAAMGLVEPWNLCVHQVLWNPPQPWGAHLQGPLDQP